MVARLCRLVQAFPNQMMETTTDKNFLAGTETERHSIT